MQATAADNERLYHEARRAVGLRDEFLSIAAHELKTPLTSLWARVQLQRRRLDSGEPADPERIAGTLRAVDEQAAKLTRLVNQLLDISRIETGRLALDLATTDLSILVRSAVTEAQESTTRHTLVAQTPAALEATVDPLRFEQVLGNLLENAIKYSPGGGPIEVLLEAKEPGWGAEGAEESTESAAAGATVAAGPSAGVQPGVWFVLSVRDHGTGVPPEDRDRLFDRFFQAHAGGHLSGMGLGLYVSRQIAELHGGAIAAEFPPDGGTRLVMTLPRGGPAGDTLGGSLTVATAITT